MENRCARAGGVKRWPKLLRDITKAYKNSVALLQSVTRLTTTSKLQI
jgi:hypothetical protein